MLATKFFAPMGDGPEPWRGSSRRWIMRECEDSLRRLGTDHIDLYQIHRPDPDDRHRRDARRARPTSCTRARSATSGSSTFPASAIVEAQWVAERRDRERFVCEQPPYSILVRGIEADVLPTCERYGMGVIPWSPLAGGWLSGKWRKGGRDLTQPPGRAGSPTATTSTQPENQRKLDAADALGVARRRGRHHASCTWRSPGSSRNPAVTSAIIGPRTMEQLDHASSARPTSCSTDDVLDRIDEIVPPGTNFTLGRRRLQPADGRLGPRRAGGEPGADPLP